MMRKQFARKCAACPPVNKVGRWVSFVGARITDEADCKHSVKSWKLGKVKSENNKLAKDKTTQSNKLAKDKTTQSNKLSKQRKATQNKKLSKDK